MGLILLALVEDVSKRAEGSKTGFWTYLPPKFNFYLISKLGAIFDRKINALSA
jgi:hypothetical protein